MALVQYYAPINVKPQGREGSAADPGEFDIFMGTRVKFPAPKLFHNATTIPTTSLHFTVCACPLTVFMIKIKQSAQEKSFKLIFNQPFPADLPSKLYLHELLTGSEIYVEPLRFPEKVLVLCYQLKNQNWSLLQACHCPKVKKNEVEQAQKSLKIEKIT